MARLSGFDLAAWLFAVIVLGSGFLGIAGLGLGLWHLAQVWPELTLVDQTVSLGLLSQVSSRSRVWLKSS